MGYERMDHADWIERQNVALNKQSARRNRPPLPKKLSEFQAKVADIFGMVGGGIYNAPICSLEKIQWDYSGRGVALTWFREMSTWDFDQLTRLVFLCHAARIRCQIEACAPRIMKLSFWPRSHEGQIAVRHPSLGEAVSEFQKWLPSDHRIIYTHAVNEAEVAEA
jgi:hypothetical protein